MLPALENAEEDISVEMKSKQKFPAVTPDNSVPHPVKASKAMPHNEQGDFGWLCETYSFNLSGTKVGMFQEDEVNITLLIHWLLVSPGH